MKDFIPWEGPHARTREGFEGEGVADTTTSIPHFLLSLGGRRQKSEVEPGKMRRVFLITLL